MRFALYLTISLGLLSGCNGLDRLVNGQQKSRDDTYDTLPVSTPVPRAEPYAVMAGYRPDGERIYLIHWTGSNLDNTAMLESEVNLRGYPKYQS